MAKKTSLILEVLKFSWANSSWNSLIRFQYLGKIIHDSLLCSGFQFHLLSNSFHMKVNTFGFISQFPTIRIWGV